MGITDIRGRARGSNDKEETVRFLVDSGAIYLLLPKSVSESIGLAPKRHETFVLADGTTVEQDVSECHLSLPQGDGHTPVILGEPGDRQALPGVVTLEILGLAFNPFSRALQPMRMLLA